MSTSGLYNLNYFPTYNQNYGQNYNSDLSNLNYYQQPSIWGNYSTGYQQPAVPEVNTNNNSDIMKLMLIMLLMQQKNAPIQSEVAPTPVVQTTAPVTAPAPVPTANPSADDYSKMSNEEKLQVIKNRAATYLKATGNDKLLNTLNSDWLKINIEESSDNFLGSYRDEKIIIKPGTLNSYSQERVTGTLLHELTHASDRDNIDSVQEEVEAYSLQEEYLHSNNLNIDKFHNPNRTIETEKIKSFVEQNYPGLKQTRAEAEAPAPAPKSRIMGTISNMINLVKDAQIKTKNSNTNTKTKTNTFSIPILMPS